MRGCLKKAAMFLWKNVTKRGIIAEILQELILFFPNILIKRSSRCF